MHQRPPRPVPIVPASGHRRPVSRPARGASGCRAGVGSSISQARPPEQRSARTPTEPGLTHRRTAPYSRCRSNGTSIDGSIEERGGSPTTASQVRGWSARAQVTTFEGRTATVVKSGATSDQRSPEAPDAGSRIGQAVRDDGQVDQRPLPRPRRSIASTWTPSPTSMLAPGASAIVAARPVGGAWAPSSASDAESTPSCAVSTPISSRSTSVRTPPGPISRSMTLSGTRAPRRRSLRSPGSRRPTTGAPSAPTPSAPSPTRARCRTARPACHPRGSRPASR